MEEKLTELKLLKEKLDGFRAYSDDIARDYINLLHEITDFLKNLKYDEDKRRLNMRMKEAHYKLRIEVNDRFDNHYFTMREKKKADELRYSRSIVSTAMKRIIRNL